MQTKLISDVQLSPDNETVLFVATEAKIESEKGVSLSKIYKRKINTRENVVSFSNPEYSSSQPRWSPDGQWIAFLSKRNGINTLYLLPVDCGEAIALIKEKNDVQTFSWSPNGQKIAFIMTDETEEQKNAKKTSLAYEYRKNEKVNRLWIIDVFTSERLPKVLTSDSYFVRGLGELRTDCEFDWSPDSSHITFAYSPGISLDNFYLNSSLATVNISTNTIVPWKKHAYYEALPRYSPDGRSIAYLTNDSTNKYAINSQVAIRSENGENLRFLAPSSNEGAFLVGPSLLGWTNDGKSVLFYEP